MRKPVQNEKFFDPGQMRHSVSFYKEVSADDGHGGTKVVPDLICTQRAAASVIRENDQLALQLGVTRFDVDRWFTVRAVPGFVPVKDLLMVAKGQKYTVRGVVPQGAPVRHYKILGAKQE